LQDLGSFLKGYMLGVVSNINEMLQDVQGKKTTASKQQILRSLGALATHIGPAISSVAPQVWDEFLATFFTR
jgi:serine/threonine-protein kinase ATR